MLMFWVGILNKNTFIYKSGGYFMLGIVASRNPNVKDVQLQKVRDACVHIE